MGCHFVAGCRWWIWELWQNKEADAPSLKSPYSLVKPMLDYPLPLKPFSWSILLSLNIIMKSYPQLEDKKIWGQLRFSQAKKKS